jgi:hypothetical protein
MKPKNCSESIYSVVGEISQYKGCVTQFDVMSATKRIENSIKIVKNVFKICQLRGHNQYHNEPFHMK